MSDCFHTLRTKLLLIEPPSLGSHIEPGAGIARDCRQQESIRTVYACAAEITFRACDGIWGAASRAMTAHALQIVVENGGRDTPQQLAT